MPDFCTTSVNQIRAIYCCTLSKSIINSLRMVDETVIKVHVQCRFHCCHGTDATLMIIYMEASACIRLPSFQQEPETMGLSTGVNCTESTANAKTHSYTALHVGFHFACYYASTHTTLE